MSFEQNLHFNIEGMTCSNCVNSIETTLITEFKEISKINVDLVSKRARIVLKRKVNPNLISQAIADVGFDANYIPEANKRVLRFSLKGLKDNTEGMQIVKKMEMDPTLVESCQLNYSTRVLTVVAYTEKAKDEVLINRIKKTIKQGAKNNALVPELIVTPFEGRMKSDNPGHFYRKAMINALVAVPLMLAGSYIPLPVDLYGQLIGLVLGGISLGIMSVTGKEFYSDAWKQFTKKRQFNMNTLIALGTGSAWVYSMIQILMPMLFPMAALSYQFLAIFLILGIINLGKGVRGVAQEQTRKKVLSLEDVFLNLQPPIARRIKKSVVSKNNSLVGLTAKDVEEISYLDIKEGDVIEILPNSRCPVEGTILSNTTTRVTQDTLTGESTPLEKTKGDDVYSGSHNLLNTIYIKATRDGKNSYLTKVINDVAKASGSKPTISRLVDKIARYFVPTIITLSFLTAAGWFLLGPVPALPWMIKSAMSVLLCACPCALGLATPISTTVGVDEMMNNGILVRDAQAIEMAANIDIAVFDKTGTLTTQSLRKISNKSREFTDHEILQRVISVETACVKKLGHDHPIARTFMNTDLGLDLHKCDNPRKDEQGVSGIIDGQEVLVGSYAHLESRQISNLSRFVREEKLNAKEGMSSVYVAIGGKCVAVIGLKHEIQPEAVKTVRDLKRMGISVYMLTGDKKGPAEKVAKQVGINIVLAERNHKEKERFIRNLARHHRVAMIGDGINDVKAIRAAKRNGVGIAVGPWTHASSVAQISVHNLNIVPVILIARETMRNIRQNLGWTWAYNIFSLTAAAGILYPVFGIVLNPVIASILMSLSSIIVVINSCRLIYEIEQTLGRYKGKINRPRTFWQKLENILALKGFIKVIRLILGKESETQRRQDNPDFYPVKQEKISGRSTRSKNRNILNRLPPGLRIKKEKDEASIIVIDDEESISLGLRSGR